MTGTSLRLPAFLANYQKFAADAAKESRPYDRYLLALTEQELAVRERNRIARLIKAARFPVMSPAIPRPRTSRPPGS